MSSLGNRPKNVNQILKGLPATGHRQRRAAKAIAAATAATLETPPQIAFQHSVLCQTSLPYRDPGPGIRVWDREQGAVSLRINAGEAKNPKTGKWVQLDLPFGPKPRLILAQRTASRPLCGVFSAEIPLDLKSALSKINSAALPRQRSAWR